MDDTIDHQSNKDSVKEGNSFYTTSSGTKCRQKTTNVWELCVQCKDGLLDRISSKDTKNSYPLEVADYSVANSIEQEPVFAW